MCKFSSCKTNHAVKLPDTYRRKGKVPCLPSITGFSSKLVFNLAQHSGRAPSVPGWDLNPGPLRLEANALLNELSRPDYKKQIYKKTSCSEIFKKYSTQLSVSYLGYPSYQHRRSSPQTVDLYDTCVGRQRTPFCLYTQTASYH